MYILNVNLKLRLRRIQTNIGINCHAIVNVFFMYGFKLVMLSSQMIVFEVGQELYLTLIYPSRIVATYAVTSLLGYVRKFRERHLQINVSAVDSERFDPFSRLAF